MNHAAGYGAAPARIIAALVPLLLVAPANATCDAVDPLDLLPTNSACTGWTRDGDPRAAYTYEELTQIIDGGAGLFAQYGFVAAAFQNYLGEIAVVVVPATVSVFNQGTAENAEALYGDPDSGMGDPIEDWSGTGEARLRVAFGITTLQFREECCFGSLVLMSEDPGAAASARCLAMSVVEGIQAAVPNQPTSWGKIRSAFFGRSR